MSVELLKGFKLSAPSKTFLSGEYVALEGGPCVVLNTDLKFSLIGKPIKSLEQLEKVTGVEKLSPAGLFFQENISLFENYELKFVDPYVEKKLPKGGLGASTAQFALLYGLKELIKGNEIIDSIENREELLKEYKRFAWDGAGLAPSGADLLSQYFGKGICLINNKNKLLENIAWPFEQLDFLIVRMGEKVATHLHLKNKDIKITEELFIQSEKVMKGLRVCDESIFIEGINGFSSQLEKNNLVLNNTLDFLTSVKLIDGVVASKGCGALGADMALIVFNCRIISKEYLEERVLELGKNTVASKSSLTDSLLGNSKKIKNVFEEIAHGKWILSGEHTVLRGGDSLVFPVFSKEMKLKFSTSQNGFSYKTVGEQASILKFFFEKILDKSLCLVSKRKSDLNGVLELKNEIPIGTGLGSSAALSVLVAKWFAWLGWIEETELFSFAKELENLSHGESSGVDIAAVLREEGIVFSKNTAEINAKNNSWKKVEYNWQPNFYLCYSGNNSLTQKCVENVRDKIIQDEELGREIDNDMKDSVRKSLEGFKLAGEEGEALIVESMELAQSCFSRWGLINSDMEDKIKWMKDNGAVAVKPVGSGDGGYLLGLWQTVPSQETRSDLISCF